LFSSEYGWDDNQTLSLTLRQLTKRIDAIVKRRNDDNSFAAAIHGVKLKQQLPTVNFSQEESDKALELLKSRVNHGRL